MSFRSFWDLGYRSLVPIVPPGSVLSAKSALRHEPDAIGKKPGIRKLDGTWCGLPGWQALVTTEADIDRWQAMGAGIGIRTGDGLLAIDADTRIRDHAVLVRDIVDDELGRLPIRVGNEPKALYVCRVSEDIPSQRLRFGKPDANGKQTELVEILAKPKQFVAHGVHPGTKRAYHWPRPPVPFDDLPVFSPEKIRALFERLRLELPNAGHVTVEKGLGSGTDRSRIDQSSLRDDSDRIRSAVAMLPNRVDMERDYYVNVGIAIKAAVEDEFEAFDIYSEWCERWEGGYNDPKTVAADWQRMHPPFGLGAMFLYQEASRYAERAVAPLQSAKWLSPIEDEAPSPFQAVMDEEARARLVEAPAIKWIDIGSWEGVEPPERQWIVDGLIPKKEVTLLYGNGGVGKTLLMHQLATCVAAGASWLGQKVQQGKALCFLAEDSEAELHKRQSDINRSLGIGMAAIRGNLRITSRRAEDNALALWDRNTGAMRIQAIYDILLAEISTFGADLVILDTLSDIYVGSEIDRAQVNAFVKRCLVRIVLETGATVITLGHPSAAGMATGQGTSGSTGWNNAVRSRLYMTRPDGDEIGPFRELTSKKLNYGPVGARLKLRYNAGAFDLVAGSLPSDGAPGIPSLDEAVDDAVIAAVASLSDEPMSMAKTSPYFAVKVLRERAADMLRGVSADEVAMSLARLQRRGVIVVANVGRKANRMPVRGLVVRREAMLTPVNESADTGAFD